VQNRPPPEPDIRCVVAGEGPVAFELVELCNPELAKDLGDQTKRGTPAKLHMGPDNPGPWAKQRALICVDTGAFSDAVAGLRGDRDENPLTKGVVSSDQAMRGYKTAMDAALGRSSQALTEWIEGLG
jgi:hypothetical protein